MPLNEPAPTQILGNQHIGTVQACDVAQQFGQGTSKCLCMADLISASQFPVGLLGNAAIAQSVAVQACDTLTSGTELWCPTGWAFLPCL